MKFRDTAILPKPLPDSVLLLLPTSYYEYEQITGTYPYEFEVI